ncbi:hypothetical protein [Paraburkholderia sp. BCC1886]|uniref:hypothetical protein n=1 Tax=Paraburkholderia sp. BCC1886 TaxID=2562670 RepID=UPI0011828E7F|nr:hypothetical protein [Paraburkholderia sp. BCC1886]
MVYWACITIGVPALMPLVLAGLVKAISGSLDGKEIKWLAPYTEGQLGYVAMGWSAATLYELDLLARCPPDPLGSIEGARWFLYVLMAAGSLSAAVGAVANKTKKGVAKFSAQQLWTILSVFASMVALAAMYRIHSVLEVHKCAT